MSLKKILFATASLSLMLPCAVFAADAAAPAPAAAAAARFNTSRRNTVGCRMDGFLES